VVDNNLDFSISEKIIADNLSKYQGNAVVMISKNGKLVYHKNFGTEFNENNSKAIASATKWLAGAAIMALVDEGKLSLNDSVGKYLPSFTKYKKGKITIRQLFSHTSGLPAESPQGFESRRDISLAQCCDSIAAKVAMQYTPGSTFYYGGLSMQVAGRVAEVASGKSFQTLFNEKIAIPCGMGLTIFSVLNANNPRIAGGGVCSARDYLNFLEMTVANGIYKGKQVLSEKALVEMELDQTNGAAIGYTPYPSNQFAAYTTKPVRYGIGLWRDVVVGNDAIEVSSPGAFGTHPWRNRNQKVAGIIFTVAEFTVVQESNLRFREAARKVLE
jgi:CubicO group peptidase (beta-lactamase class C family)